MLLIRTIPLPFAGDTWAVPGNQSGPPGNFPVAIAVASHRQPAPYVPLRWRVIAYSVAGAPLTETASRIDARLAFLANDASGNRTVALGPSLIDCKGQTQPLGITLNDTVLVDDEIAFAIPSLTIVGAAASLRIFADYGAVPR